MRYFEIMNGIRVPISQEEQDVLDKAKATVSARDLNEREREIARRMVSRGVLNRIDDGEKVYFEPNDMSRIWRF